MARIAWDDASTHGKFISYYKESNQHPSDCQFSCPHSTVTRRYILDKLGILPTMLRLLVRLRYLDSLGDNKKKDSRVLITSRRTV